MSLFLLISLAYHRTRCQSGGLFFYAAHYPAHIQESGESGQRDRVQAVTSGGRLLEWLRVSGRVEDVKEVVEQVEQSTGGSGRRDAEEDQGQGKELREEGESDGSCAHRSRRMSKRAKWSQSGKSYEKGLSKKRKVGGGSLIIMKEESTVNNL